MTNSTIKKEQIRDIPLTVMDSDGSPSIYPVDTIIFSGATITDQGGGNVLVTLSGSGSASALQVEQSGGTVITGVDRIIFSGASVTNLGSGDALVTFSGGVGGTINRTFTFTSEGNLSVSTGKLRMYNTLGQTVTISKVFASVYSAPTGATILIDINKNGTTIFTSQANRPSIAISANTGSTTTINVPSLADGDYLTMDIDQVGSTNPGAELSVQVVFS